MTGQSEQAEVAIIGRGLAGMAASIHLARAGFRVVCIGPAKLGTAPVGESLDWSAPALLANLGLPMERLIGEGMATYKRHVTAKLMDGSARQYVPGEWLARPPYNVELRTLHLDRFQFDAALDGLVRHQGVEIVDDRVVDVETDGRRVLAVRTLSGQRISSSWFIDASGSNARLFPRSLHLDAVEYGAKKVAMWSHLRVPDSVEGTTLYLDGQPAYLEWIWEIPVQPDLISVGYIASGEAIKDARQRGLTMEQIYRERLARVPRFTALLEAKEAFTPHVTSFQCRVHRGIVGPNWVITGEAASMVDPMTSNGVTAALRSAAEASSLVIQSRHRHRLPRVASAM